MGPYAPTLPSRLLFLHDEAVRKADGPRLLMEEYFCLVADMEVRPAVGRGGITKFTASVRRGSRGGTET